MNCGKCRSPLTYGVSACAVCGTPVAWDQAPMPQAVAAAMPTALQPQPTLITPAQATPVPQPIEQPLQAVATSQQTQATQTPTQQPQYMQTPAILAATEPAGKTRVAGVTAAGVTSIVLGAMQLLISLAAFTDEEVAATSGSGFVNVGIGLVFIALGVALIRATSTALLRKLCIGFAVLSMFVVVLSFVIVVAGYHYVIALGFAGFALWKLFRSR